MFALDGRAVHQLDTRSGLPSDRVTGLTSMRGTLYISCGSPHASSDSSSHLLAYDLHSRRLRVLATNTRHEKTSPFDDAASFDVPDMFADPSRDRMVFSAIQTKGEGRRRASRAVAHPARSGRMLAGRAGGYARAVETDGRTGNQEFSKISRLGFFYLAPCITCLDHIFSLWTHPIYASNCAMPGSSLNANCAHFWSTGRSCAAACTVCGGVAAKQGAGV